MAPEKRNALLAAMEAIYDQEHAVKITLTERDLVAADLNRAGPTVCLRPRERPRATFSCYRR
jgi:hypothetical protein